MYEDTTINGWLRQPGPINLRRDPERKPTTNIEMRGAQSIIVAVMFVANCILYVGFVIPHLLHLF